MKNLTIILILTVIIFGSATSARAAVDGPLITPDSFFWKFKLAGERVVLAFEGLGGKEARMNYLSDLVRERRLEIVKMYFQGQDDLDQYSKARVEQKHLTDKYLTVLHSIEEDQRLEQLKHDQFFPDEFDPELDFSTMITNQTDDVKRQILEAQKNGNQKKEAELANKLRDLKQSYDDSGTFLESWQADAKLTLDRTKNMLTEDDRKEFLGKVSDEPKSTIVPTTIPTPISRILLTPTPLPIRTSFPTTTPTSTPWKSFDPIPTTLITPTPISTQTPIPAPSISSGPTPSVSATPTPSVSLTPTPNVSPTPSPSVIPTLTPTPSVSATPTPSLTPTPTPQASNGDLGITITSNYCTDGGELMGFGWRWSWHLSGTAKTSHDYTFLRVLIPWAGGSSQTSCSSWGQEGGSYCMSEPGDPGEIQWSFMWDGIALSSSPQHASIWYNPEGSTSPTKVEVEFMECPSTVINRY